MGLLDEVFPKKKETSKIRIVKNTSAKRTPDKSSHTTSAEKVATSQASNSLIFDSLKRVQGALSPSLRHKSSKQDLNKIKTNTEIKTADKERGKEKIKDRDKIKSKDKDHDKEKRPWFRSSSKVSLRKDPIKSSTASLNVGTSVQKIIAFSSESKKKRPTTVYSDNNVTFRRGQNTKIEGQNLGDNLSRTSSVTNLDVEPKSGKGAKPRKSSSRDRIDKIGETRKNDKKGIIRNNNKLDSGENPYPSVDSLSEEELLQLRRQLQEMAQEKTNLALQLGEQKGHLNILQKEIQKLKEESNIQLEHLTEENTALRNRLRDVAHSPLSDNEKQQLLFDSHRHHSSAPASIATNIIDDGTGGDTTCTTPDWDKHSSGNVSEISVACLQDKINQMQETHYSTNEELQATLQELTDLQRQLTDLQQENERLNEEKTLMFDSLCRQTERLNDSRSEVESLKQLLYQEKDDTGQFESAVEREQKLVDLLKSAQEEREGFLVKLEQINNELQETRSGIIEKDEQIAHLRDRVKTLECTLDAQHAEHKLLDQELAQAKDQCSGKQIEINRLTDLLDNARTKINEFEQDRALSDKSELDELLDNARKEKDSLESEVAHLKEQLAISKNEIEKLKEQVSILQEECKVTRNNAKTTQSDLEYKCEKLVKEKNILNEQLQEFQEALNELQVQSQCQLEDKRQLSAVLSETQRNLSESERKNLTLENEVDELKKQRLEESEEWEKFQDDLLTSVRVANDFKTEAQQELQRMAIENKQYRERERQLKAEIEKLKGGTIKLSNKENQDMDMFIKRPTKNKQRLRQNSGTASSSSKSDKTSSGSIKDAVKRRENRSLKAKRLKTLSLEEEMLLKSLNSYHAEIDNTLPDEFLTEEQKVIRKLKIIYEDDYLKVKPVALKPKDQLAISKPLLDSVLTNPKLMEILKNPAVKTIEDMASFEKEAPAIRNIIRDIDRKSRGKSENFDKPEKRISIIGRSISLNQVHKVDTVDKKLRLYRTVETEDLTEEFPINVEQRVSSLVPSDSISNYNKRYSDFAPVINKKSDTSIFNQNVKYSTLERIVKSIPKNVPESKLSSEQRFALKLLAALEERKNTLKKSEKAKTLPISKPTEESVLRNPKLKEIVYDPDIKFCRRNSETYRPNSVVMEDLLRPSKSYNDITFTFDGKRIINMYNSPSESSSSTTFSSAEFNVETSEVGPYTESCPVSTKSNSLPAPLSTINVNLSTFSRQKSSESDTVYDQNKFNHKTKVIVHKVPLKMKDHFTKQNENLNDASIDQCKVLNSNTKYMDRNVDSLLYNENKLEYDQIEKNLRVDLLQKKIKKITKKDGDNEKNKLLVKSNDAVASYSFPLVLNSTKDKALIEISEPSTLLSQDPYFKTTETIDALECDEIDSLVYNETLTRVKKLTMLDSNDLEASEKFQEINKPVEENREIIDLAAEKDVNHKEEENKKQKHDKMKVLNDAPSIKESNVVFKCTESIEIDFLNVNSDNIDVDYGSLDDVNVLFIQSPEYDYRKILKENRVGVTSPLNYRLSYKDVVQEFKNRFSTDEEQLQIMTKNVHEPHLEEEIDIKSRETQNSIKKLNEHVSNLNSDVQTKNNEIHVENIEQTKENTVLNGVEIRTNKTNIDKEMEHIFEHYLNTRVSQIIKQTEDKVQNVTQYSEKLNEIQNMSTPIKHENELNLSNLLPLKTEKSIEQISTATNDNYGLENSDLRTISPKASNSKSEFDYSKLSPKQLTFSDNSYFELKDGNVKHIKLFEDIDQTFDIDTRVGESNKDCKNDTLTKDSKQLNKNSLDLDLYNLSDSPVFEVTTFTEMKEAVKDVNTPANLLEWKNPITSVQLEINNSDNINHPSANNISEKAQISDNPKVDANNLNLLSDHTNVLTEEDLDIIHRVKKETIRRPLSAINDEDLALIKSISLNYLNDNKEVQNIDLNVGVEEAVKNVNTPANLLDWKNPITSVQLEINNSDNINHPSANNINEKTQISDNPKVDANNLNLLSDHTNVLTEEDLDIIHRVKKETIRRPLSAINDEDLALIKSISLNYLNDNEEVQHTDLNVSVEPKEIVNTFADLTDTDKKLSISKQQNSQPVTNLDLSNKLSKYSFSNSMHSLDDQGNIETKMLIGDKTNLSNTDEIIFKNSTDNSTNIKTQPNTSVKETDKNNAWKSKILSSDNNEMSDDLDMLLGKISTSMNKTSKRKLNKIEQYVEPKSILNIKEKDTEEKNSNCSSIVNISAIEAPIKSDLGNLSYENINSKHHEIGTVDETSFINVESSIDVNDDKKSRMDCESHDLSFSNLNTKTNRNFENVEKNHENIKVPDSKHLISLTQNFSVQNNCVKDTIYENINDSYNNNTTGGPSNIRLTNTGTLEKNIERYVILQRNKPANRKEVKSLNFDSDNNDLTKGLQSLSSRPKSISVQLRSEKKVKSFAQHFERLSLERSIKPEPVYVNARFALKSQKMQYLPSIKSTDKKPLPVPRIRNQVVKDSDNLNDTYSSDRYAVMKKMSEENRNFSASDRENINEEITSSVVTSSKVERPPINQEKQSEEDTKVPYIYEPQNRRIITNLVSDSTEDEEEGFEPFTVPSKTGIQKSEKFSDKRQLLNSVENVREQMNEVGGATASYSVIAVANTAEKLDLRTPSEVDISRTRKNNASNLNLFNIEGIETQSFDDVYLGVYKTRGEDRMISELNRKKMGYNLTYLREFSDTESFDDPKLSLDGDSNSKPKIVDFVPLDDATKPFFANSNNILKYHALEVENAASKVKTTSELKDDVIVTVKSEINLTDFVPKKSLSNKSEPLSIFDSNIDINESNKADVNVSQTKSQIKILTEDKNTPNAKTVELFSKSSSETRVVDVTKDIDKKTMFSAAKKVFQDLEAKNSKRVSSKETMESESTRSGVNLSVIGKTAAISDAESIVSNKEDVELSQEEINKEI